MGLKKGNNKKTGGMKLWLGGKIFTDERVERQLPFIFFLAFLGIVLITNRNWSERTIKQIVVLKETLNELRAESITLSAKLMDASRPSVVLKKVEDAGISLQEPLSPPQKLIVKEK